MPAAPLQQQFPALKSRFPNTPNFEIGWGDKGFYQASDITAGIVLKAVFGLSGSIMHIFAVPNTPRAYFPENQMKQLCLSNTQLEQLNSAIIDSMALSASHDVQALGKGLYGDSEFFAAQGAYHVLNTCNTWTAQRLKRAGFAIQPRFKLSASSVMDAIADLPEHCTSE
ncbi:DUF2459 domain-containing protein [Chitinibacter sp. SCUT-21]